MPVIIAQNDPIIRAVQVLLDPDTDPERVAAIADYYSVDVADPQGWFDAVRASTRGLYPFSVRMVASQEEFAAALPEADGVVIEDLELGAAELTTAPRLKVVQNFGTVTRNIDGAACAERGIPVHTLRRRVNIAVAEHAFAMMIALAKRICEITGRIDEKSLHDAGFPARMYDRRHAAAANWARVDGLGTLYGATIGALGLGEIGREVAGRAAAFGMKVLYHQRNRAPAEVEQALSARYVGFEELLAESDYISIHLPLTQATEGMIDAAAIGRMKKGARLVNISRANIIDRDALIAGLESGRLGGAGLDVHYKEPAEPGDALLRFPNVVLTPHTAVASRANATADMEELVGNLVDALAG